MKLIEITLPDPAKNDILQKAPFLAGKRFKINSDGSVDVYDELDFELERPMQIQIDTVHSDCWINVTGQVDTFKGLPRTAMKDFGITGLQTDSLQGCPTHIGGAGVFRGMFVDNVQGVPRDLKELVFSCSGVKTFSNIHKFAPAVQRLVYDAPFMDEDPVIPTNLLSILLMPQLNRVEFDIEGETEMIPVGKILSRCLEERNSGKSTPKEAVLKAQRQLIDAGYTEQAKL